MPATKKTDNHYTADKVALRVNSLPETAGPVRVLDAFGGRGVIWRGVARASGRDIQRHAIDARLDLDQEHMHGDNVKVMAGLDLSAFDVIDLDAYGVPVDQLKLVFASRFRGVVFVTMIQTMHGGLPHAVAKEIGLPPTLPTVANTLIGRRGWEYFCAWLSLKGVDKIRLRAKGRKRYFAFRWGDQAAAD